MSPRAIAVLFLVLFLGVAAYLSVPKSIAESKNSAQVAAALDATAGPEHEPPPLGERTKTEGCAIAGAYPDAACTPGEVFTDKTLEQICTPGYTKTVRNVSQKTREAVFAEYGIEYPVPRGSYEVDHFIPLALGGDNSIANLFPEAAEPRPGFKEKDVVEVYLYEEVCAGRADLSRAQRLIAHDWLSVYQSISDSDMKRIRQKYASWSN